MNNLNKTALYEEHIKLKAKMVDFNGWQMPISYSSIIQEHQQVKKSCGVFDVSHMGIIDIKGQDAQPLLIKLTVNDVESLSINQSHYTMMCDESGNILDDMICTKREDCYRLVVNCGNFDKIWTWIMKQIDVFGFNVELVHQNNTAIIAVQGPESMSVVQDLLGQEIDIKSFHVTDKSFKNHPITISRTGYTGECGVEMFVNNNYAPEIWLRLLDLGVAPIGLGARDTLRIEAGLPLYGHEIYPGISPFDLGYGWIVKNRSNEFIGADIILQKKMAAKNMYGIIVNERMIPRQGCEVLDVGYVTSGTFSPSLNSPMALVITDRKIDADSPVRINIRNREVSGKIVLLPFVKKGC